MGYQSVPSVCHYTCCLRKSHHGRSVWDVYGWTLTLDLSFENPKGEASLLDRWRKRGSLHVTFQCLESSWLRNRVNMFPSPLFLLRYVCVGYFDGDGVLMIKWHSRNPSRQDDWPSVCQIVIPVTLRQEIEVGSRWKYDRPSWGQQDVWLYLA